MLVVGRWLLLGVVGRWLGVVGVVLGGPGGGSRGAQAIKWGFRGKDVYFLVVFRVKRFFFQSTHVFLLTLWVSRVRMRSRCAKILVDGPFWLQHGPHGFIFGSFLRLWGLGTQQKWRFYLGKMQLLKFAY